MGKASRAREARQDDIDEQIRQEHEQYPYLWADVYSFEIRRKHSDQMRKMTHQEYESIWLTGTIDEIVERAEAMQAGLGVVVKGKLEKQREERRASHG